MILFLFISILSLLLSIAAGWNCNCDLPSQTCTGICRAGNLATINTCNKQDVCNVWLDFLCVYYN